MDPPMGLTWKRLHYFLRYSHEASEAIKHLQMTEENEENWTRFKKLILLQVRD